MGVSNLHGLLTIGREYKQQAYSTVQLAARFTTTPASLAPGAVANIDNIRGVHQLSWTRTMDFAPAAASNTNIGTSQSVNAGASAVLTAGAGVTQTTRGTTTVYRLDTPRCVVITSAGNDAALTWTVSGFDEYGVAMTSAFTGGNTSGVTSPKAFLDISSVVASTTSASSVSIGTSNVFGLAILAAKVDDLMVYYNSTLQTALGAAFTAGDATSPATALTKDVRGTVSLAATDGTKIVTVGQLNPNFGAISATPSAALIQVYGQNQV